MSVSTVAEQRVAEQQAAVLHVAKSRAAGQLTMLTDVSTRMGGGGGGRTHLGELGCGRGDGGQPLSTIGELSKAQVAVQVREQDRLMRAVVNEERRRQGKQPEPAMLRQKQQRGGRRRRRKTGQRRQQRRVGGGSRGSV